MIAALLSCLFAIIAVIVWYRTLLVGREIRANTALMENHRQELRDLLAEMERLQPLQPRIPLHPHCHLCNRPFTQISSGSWEHVYCPAQKETP